MKEELLALISDTKALLLHELPKVPKKKPTHLPPPAPLPKPEKIVEPPPPKPEPEFQLEKPKLDTAKADSIWGNVLGKIAPTVNLHKAPPSDEGAKKSQQAARTKAHAPPILLLTSSHYAKFHALLSNIARALDIRFGACKLVDVAKLDTQEKWEALFNSPNLRLIISPDGLLFSHPTMLANYQEIPQKKERTLGNKPLLLLPDPSLYIKDPLLKRSLWTVLCKTLES